MIVTVTLNAAIDRTLTVPELPARAAAPCERRRDARRREGHQRRTGAEDARRARRRDGPGRRQHRHAHRRGADRRGDPQRLRPHRRRVAHLDRRRRHRQAAPTPRSTSGGRRCAPRSSRCCSRSSATSRRAPSSSSSQARCRASVADDFYAEVARELTRRHVPIVLDTEGEPLRLGDRGGAVPRLAEPARGGGARRPGVPRRRGLPARARPHRRDGRPERADHDRDRLRRAAARGARDPALPCDRAHVEAVSTVGSGDVLLGGYLAARHAGRTPEESLRAAVAAGAASTLEVGAGRFDPRQAGRLQAGVEPLGARAASPATGADRSLRIRRRR